jgi:hypothetical protein
MKLTWLIARLFNGSEPATLNGETTQSHKLEICEVSKKENHKQDLIGLFDEFVEIGDAERLMGYIVSNSNLPGRRANLELAEAFADVVEGYSEKEDERLWELCIGMTEILADQAPVNDPKEFIPFCGAIGIGAIGSIAPEFFEKALTTLKALASDPRWRMRESVCFGLQRLMAKRSRDTLKEFEGWISDGDLLEMRAAAATVAEPAILKDKETAISALQLHRKIITQVLEVKERKSEGFRILRKALGYTLSVVVRAIPKEGFEFVAQLVDSQDSDVLWIVKENLKKNRLVKNFPEQVESMKKSLRGSF